MVVRVEIPEAMMRWLQKGKNRLQAHLGRHMTIGSYIRAILADVAEDEWTSESLNSPIPYKIAQEE